VAQNQRWAEVTEPIALHNNITTTNAHRTDPYTNPATRRLVPELLEAEGLAELA